MEHLERLRRLLAARATGHVPRELIPWLIELAAAGVNESPVVIPPAERLALALSTEVDRWMRRRGLTDREISVPRSTLQRVLKGQDTRLSSIADIADALACDVEISFRARKMASYVKPCALADSQ